MPGFLSRRRFIVVAGAATAAATSGAVVFRTLLAGAEEYRWTDGRAFGGSPPGPDDVVRITDRVVLDTDVEVRGVVVEAGGALIFEPGSSRSLTSRGNVIVRGRLEMKPDHGGVTHVLRFTGAEEAGFAGGGMDPVDSDVGLWVMGDGVLDLAGSPRKPWLRAAGPVPAGAGAVELAGDPAGWRTGDEIVLTPTLPVTEPLSWAAYDAATITGVNGRGVALSSPTRFAHPAARTGLGGDRSQPTELLNLTRNVRIEGLPGRRSHIFVRSTQPQSIRHVALRHLGPRRDVGFVLGRYALHLHFCDNGSRGSIVDGVVARECGSHCFVPHMSHGVTFTECISHDTWEDPFWWDPPKGGHPTHDTAWEHCVASLVQSDPKADGHVQLTGFNLGLGTGNKVRGCIATGVLGGQRSSGFKWPSPPVIGTWEFVDAIAHNNRGSGIFVWQNVDDISVIERFLAYSNGNSGIEHGAYKNSYIYRDSVLHANGFAGVLLHSKSRPPGLRFERIVVEGAGVTPYGFYVVNSPVEGDPALLADCRVEGVTEADFRVEAGAGTMEQRLAFARPSAIVPQPGDP